jgi:hypothetical protein
MSMASAEERAVGMGVDAGVADGATAGTTVVGEIKCEAMAMGISLVGFGGSEQGGGGRGEMNGHEYKWSPTYLTDR